MDSNILAVNDSITQEYFLMILAHGNRLCYYQASAALYSLIVMAKTAKINPFFYLKAVFTELPKATTIEDVESLLPWIWKPESEKSIPKPLLN